MQVGIAKLLTVFILLSSITWPALSYSDQHEVHTHPPAQVMEQGKLDMTDNDGAPANDNGCDHCCHMAVHLLGCFMSYQNQPSIDPSRPLLFTFNNYNSLFPSPPYHPPAA